MQPTVLDRWKCLFFSFKSEMSVCKQTEKVGLSPFTFHQNLKLSFLLLKASLSGQSSLTHIPSSNHLTTSTYISDGVSPMSSN